MSHNRPQFYNNTLELPNINKRNLQQTLADLQDAVLNGVRIIESGHPPSGEYDGKGIFNGEIGTFSLY
jgi:NifB/MoaA-like Fe-S oxidoreductase